MSTIIVRGTIQIIRYQFRYKLGMFVYDDVGNVFVHVHWLAIGWLIGNLWVLCLASFVSAVINVWVF